MEPASSAWLCRYHYDPLDRLAGTVANNQQGVMCFYKKSRLATEINGALQRTVMEAGDQVLAQQRTLGNVIETDLLATDQQRSILTSVQASGIESLAYAAYGYQPAQSGLDSVLGFTGERCDPVTGHYLLGNGYRAFNPLLRRFNSPDNVSPFGEGGLNAYVYCAADPINGLDPTGHVPHFIITKSLRLRPGRIGGQKMIKRLKTEKLFPPPKVPRPPSDVIDLGNGRHLEVYSRQNQIDMGRAKAIKNLEQNAKNLAAYKQELSVFDMSYVKNTLAHHEQALQFYKGPLSTHLEAATTARVALNLEVDIANLRGVKNLDDLQVYRMKMSSRHAFHSWLNKVDPRHIPD